MNNTCVQETLISVPVELVLKSCGLSLDVGGSAAKVVYRSKENYEEAQKSNSKYGHLTLISTSAPNLPSVLEHIARHAVISAERSSGVVYTTGLGCTLYEKAIGAALNLKLESIPEFDSFVKAFIYLITTVPRSRLFYELNESRDVPTHVIMDLVKSLIDSGQSRVTGVDLSYLENRRAIIEKLDLETNLPVSEAEPDMLPCVLFVCGSSNAHLQVNADGSFIFLDGSTRGGLNFFGLASLLTGVQTFEELMELVRVGNARNVDVYTDQIAEEAQLSFKEEDDMYKKAIKDSELTGNVIYGFAKCVGKRLGDFRKEDLARALLDQFITDYVQTVTLVCGASGVRRCCFSGSFVSSQFIRDLITVEMDKRNLYCKMIGKPLTKYDFLESGGHLGAIGALISHYNQFIA